MSNKRTLKFKGIDDWNRPIFKVIEKDYFVGSTNKLFSHEINKKEVINYFKNNTQELCYFGSSFNCEPEGLRLKEDLEFIFLD